MIHLAEEFFDVKNNPEQIAVDEQVMGKLQALDPSSLAQEANEDGPIAWVLVIPTTEKVMREFLEGKISERKLLEETTPGQTFDAVYLCSALVLPEFRKKGVAKSLTLQSIREIRTRHPIRWLYLWPFSKEGARVAEEVAAEAKLPLLRKTV
jgi:ribosomal protein S18 acetylase RimI-like enzyme